MSLPPISIDDMNTTLIQYEGNWLGINGSTRQWDGSVHTTSQAGATATFQFRGYLLWVWGTVPAGVGHNMVQLSIDGGQGNITSRTANGSSVFNVVYFETPLLPETFHTAVITVLTTMNSTTNQSTEFQLDRFEFQTSNDPPLFAPPGVSIPGQTSSVPSSVTPSATATPLANMSGPSSSKSPVGAIAGGVIGGLALVIGILLILLWRRRKGKSVSSTNAADKPRVISAYFPMAQQRSSLLPTPFPLNNQSHNTFQTHLTEPIPPITARSNFQPSQPIVSPVSEKSVYQSESGSFTNSRWTTAGQSPSSRTPGSASSTMPNAFSSIGSPSDDGISSESLLERRDARPSIHHLTDRPSESSPSESPPSHSTLSTNTDIYDRPPPSYWYSESEPHATP